MKILIRYVTLLCVLIGLVSCRGSREEAAVTEVVEGFGQQLKTVSLLSPDAATEIQAQYAGYVSPALLQQWMAEPAQAPGRRVSSPWPDRIEISSLQRESADTYLVQGELIEVTSSEAGGEGTAARTPVTITVQKLDGTWQITSYIEG